MGTLMLAARVVKLWFCIFKGTMSDSKEKLAAFVLACYAEVLDVFGAEAQTEPVSWFFVIFSCNSFESDFINVRYNLSSSFLILPTFLLRQTFIWKYQIVTNFIDFILLLCMIFGGNLFSITSKRGCDLAYFRVHLFLYIYICLAFSDILD